MSLKETVSRYFAEVDESTAESDYSAEELATVAEDILGYDKLTVRRGSMQLGIYSKREVYSVKDGIGVKVNSLRAEPQEALGEAAEMLENGKVEVLEE